VSDILDIVGGSQANVSKHLSVLKRAGLVESRRDGLNVFYQISDDGVFAICRSVCDSLELRIDREHHTIVEGRQQMDRAGWPSADAKRGQGCRSTSTAARVAVSFSRSCSP
jgi:DNA-binding MarR family transcriptional regulator